MLEDSQSHRQGLEVTTTVAAKDLSEEAAFEGLGKEAPGRGGSECRHPCLELKNSVSSSSFFKSSVTFFFLAQKPAGLKSISQGRRAGGALRVRQKLHHLDLAVHERNLDLILINEQTPRTSETRKSLNCFLHLFIYF